MDERRWWRLASYSIVAPVVNMSIHANSILIGFILDQQHVLSAGIFYAALIIVTVSVLRMVAEISKIFGKDHCCKDDESRDKTALASHLLL